MKKIMLISFTLALSACQPQVAQLPSQPLKVVKKSVVFESAQQAVIPEKILNQVVEPSPPPITGLQNNPPPPSHLPPNDAKTEFTKYSAPSTRKNQHFIEQQPFKP